MRKHDIATGRLCGACSGLWVASGHLGYICAVVCKKTNANLYNSSLVLSLIRIDIISCIC